MQPETIIKALLLARDPEMREVADQTVVDAAMLADFLQQTSDITMLLLQRAEVDPEETLSVRCEVTGETVECKALAFYMGLKHVLAAARRLYEDNQRVSEGLDGGDDLPRADDDGMANPLAA